MVPLGTPKGKKVVPQWSPLVTRGTPQGGAPSGAPKGGDPPPKEKKSIPAPLVEQERKLKPRVKGPDLKEVVTPAQKELVVELQKMQQHDPDVVPTQGGGYGRIVRNRAGQLVGARVHWNKC